MANSRSNIYPVQLQGAELNLNKYDAEIKQYSGFYRNNAPFVGGCLSNIFTKDETIEDATSKNTYIAPNGDVYRVNTEGLFKNDEKLVWYNNYSKFVQQEDITDLFERRNVIAVFDENFYVYVVIESNEFGDVISYHAVFRNRRTGELEDNIIHAQNFLTTLYKLDIKRVYTNYYDYYIIVIYDTPSLSVKVSAFTRSNGNSYDLTKSYPLTEGYSTEKWSIICHLDNIGTDIKKLFIFPNHGSVLCYNVTIDAANGTISDSLTAMPDSAFVVSSSTPLYTATGYSIGDFYRFTEENVYFIGKKNIVQAHNNFLLLGKYEYNNNNTTPFKVTSIKNAITGYLFDAGETLYEQTNWWIKNISKFGALVLCKCKDTNNNDKLILINYSDRENPGGYSYDGNGLPCYNFGFKLSDCVLFNNEEITGISVNNGPFDVLVTPWNSIDPNNVYVAIKSSTWGYNQNNIVIHKSITGHWYKTFYGEPIIKKIDNLLITNYLGTNNYFRNCYDLKSQSLKIFASAWNNRLKVTVSNNNRTYYTENKAFFASSINEYNLQDNASLILNPLPIAFTLSNTTRNPELNDSYKGEVVNIYYGETSEVLYLYSSFIGNLNLFVNSDLVGLPFPSNTDGNIQYSPSLFAQQKEQYGNLVFISEGGTAYKLMTYDNKAVMSYFLTTAIEGLQDFFTIQGQLYGILDNQIYSFSIVNEVANRGDFIVSVKGLQFVGNTPYEALFFSKTNRCLYSFTGANILNAKQFVDKISEVRNYKYNPATHSIFLITDIGVVVYSLFGIYQIDFPSCKDMYLLNNGVILTDNEGTFKYVKYYKEETTDDYTKENITLETCFYGMNNQTVTINDCLYMRIFSEEHEEGDLEVSATTLSLEGRMTEKTTFKIRESDWDKETNTIYLRYQPKEQRGLGISFKINSPFKIASLSVGSQADAILVDKLSKGAINAPERTSNITEW